MKILHTMNTLISTICSVDPVQREGTMDSYHALHFLSMLPGRCCCFLCSENVCSVHIRENAKSVRSSCFILTYQFQLCTSIDKYLIQLKKSDSLI